MSITFIGDIVRAVLIKLFNHPLFPIGLLVLCCLVAGSLTFQDFGMGWDEPLFYKYADSIPYAYSITERLSGNFNILKAYGPSETDHMMYGPAYILAARPVALLVKSIFSTAMPSAWHLVNFILFTTGAVFLYKLSLIWLSRWAAFSAALFFVTQPLLWGHAFINPKDIPFMVFFIIAFFTGYKMVETASNPEGLLQEKTHPRRWKIVKIVLWVLFIFILFLTVNLVLFRHQIQEWIPTAFNIAIEKPTSLSGIVFRLVSNNSSNPDVKAYSLKSLLILNRIIPLLFVLTLITSALAVVATFQENRLRLMLRNFNVNLSWIEAAMAGISLGFLSAIRILGPLAGFLVSLFFVFRFKRRAISGILAYAIIAFFTMFILWPYLWRSPIGSLIAVLRHMADNPQNVPVLFNGIVISSKGLPVDYFLTMLGTTLTEPVWILFLIGAGIAVYLMVKRKLDWKEFVPFSLWFMIPFTYVILTTPPQYDGFRHFTFLLPPVFITTGFAFSKLFEINKLKWLNPILVLVIVLPGIMGIIQLHPYQYTYYNSFVGGTNGAFRRFETDYWLTCYKEVFEQLDEFENGQQILYVHRNKYLASQYEHGQIQIEQFEPDLDATKKGDLILFSTRSNYDQKFHVSDPEVITIIKNGAVFCSVRRIP